MESNKDPVPDGPPENISYPTPQNFYVEWAEGMSSPFNQRLLSVVYKVLSIQYEEEVDDFVEVHGVQELTKKIKKHVEYLKGLWMKEHHYDQADLDRWLQAHSNYTRRRAVCLPYPRVDSSPLTTIISSCFSAVLLLVRGILPSISMFRSTRLWARLQPVRMRRD